MIAPVRPAKKSALIVSKVVSLNQTIKGNNFTNWVINFSYSIKRCIAVGGRLYINSENLFPHQKILIYINRLHLNKKHIHCRSS